LTNFLAIFDIGIMWINEDKCYISR